MDFFPSLFLIIDISLNVTMSHSKKVVDRDQDHLISMDEFLRFQIEALICSAQSEIKGIS